MSCYCFLSLCSKGTAPDHVAKHHKPLTTLACLRMQMVVLLISSIGAPMASGSCRLKDAYGLWGVTALPN